MRFNLLCDANWESRVDSALNELSDTGYRAFFANHDYGEGVNGITVVFMCRDPSLEFKRRLRFAKHEKKLYMDIMLDLPEMTNASREARKKIIIQRLGEEVPTVLRKYSFADFDESRFVQDLKNWLNAVASDDESARG